MENSFTVYTLTALHRCECKTLTHTVQAGYNIHTYSSEMLIQAEEECFHKVKCAATLTVLDSTKLMIQATGHKC